MKNSKGITLVALVITIIILIILAGVTFSVLLGEDGLINKTKQGGDKYKEESIKESINLAYIGASTNANLKLNENEFKNILNEQLGEGKYTYSIDETTGEITVTIDGKEYKVTVNGVGTAEEDNNYETGLSNLEITASVENINTSAKVSAIEGRKVTIDTETIKTSTLTGGFEVNNKVMLYVSNTDSATLAGKYETYKIVSINENEITLDGNIDLEVFTGTNCQLVKIAKYGQVKIKSGVTVTPATYDGSSGGIVAIEANEIILNGKIDASKKGYDSSNIAPNNGGRESAGNPSRAGGSNKYKGGNGGKNYQGYTGLASDAVNISNNLQEKRMTFGGGSFNTTKGGGIIYINAKKVEIGMQYALSANGQGGIGGVDSGSGAGGTVCINSKNIVFTTEDKDYFVGANAGSGATETTPGYNTYDSLSGIDGNNVVGATAPNNGGSWGPSSGGAGMKSNGGGGAVGGCSGSDATETSGGNGANSVNMGWDAGSGGGGGGFVSIYTNSDLSTINLTDATIRAYYE
ncbi:MAG: hypothetical protein J6M60_05915 [Clostridia bacterium]|nr:hypothetical protein [Clostridia bacterium]